VQGFSGQSAVEVQQDGSLEGKGEVTQELSMHFVCAQTLSSLHCPSVWQTAEGGAFPEQMGTYAQVFVSKLQVAYTQSCDEVQCAFSVQHPAGGGKRGYTAQTPSFVSHDEI